MQLVSGADLRPNGVQAEEKVQENRSSRSNATTGWNAVLHGPLARGLVDAFKESPQSSKELHRLWKAMKRIDLKLAREIKELFDAAVADEGVSDKEFLLDQVATKK